MTNFAGASVRFSQKLYMLWINFQFKVLFSVLARIPQSRNQRVEVGMEPLSSTLGTH